VGKALHDRERTAKAFTTFLGHDDASRVSADDGVRYKKARLAAGRSQKTVADAFNEFSPIWRWPSGTGNLRSRRTHLPA